VIRHFLDRTKPKHSVYLISTSAGEVGIDLDADHMICDLTTLDAMIQRLGRVNRSGGEGRSARVDVVGEASTQNNSSKFDRAIAATFDCLKQWTQQQADGIDVSPGNMRRMLEKLSANEREGAFSPRPEAPPLTDILLDGWSLTSVQEMPGIPEVAAFLHGLTSDIPETFVVWRREIDLLVEAEVSDDEIRNWFRACRVESRERLRDQTHRVQKVLEKLLKNHRQSDKNKDFSVVVLDERGGVQGSQLSKIVEKDFKLAYRTVVLPVEAGGLDQDGMLCSKAVAPFDGLILDVSEKGAGDNRRERWLHYRSTNGERFERLITGEILDGPPHALREKERVILKESSEREEGTNSRDLVLFVSPRRSALEDPETTSARQTLEEHSRVIVDQMSAIARGLDLPVPIRDALVTAAWWHDKGKDRPVWQRYARNDSGVEILAKAVRYLHPRALGGYRHEFGSLLDAMSDTAIQNHPERDLVLHLIAAHHGWARPHFEPRSFDNTRTTADNEQASIEVMRRFGQLQQRFGRWGLAWLESLVRCADIAASKAAATDTVPVIEEQEVPT
jgi:CRISPR-associated endonuclease/helicase Cas3